MASTAKPATDSGSEIEVLSSIGVQGTYYNLTSITPKIEDAPARPSTSKRSPVKVQRARKTFPTAQGAFKVPAAETEPSAAALLDAREKQTVLDQMKRSYTKSSFSESDTGSESSSRKTPREVPALIHIGGEAVSPVKKPRLDSTLSEQSTILQEPIGSPPTPASTPAPPVAREDPVFAEMAALMGETVEDDHVSSTVRPVDSSPSVQEISSDSDREAAPKSDEEYLPPPKAMAAGNSSPMATTSGGSAPSNKRSRASHELERLYMDEGAARILSEMARRGTNRRSTTNTSPGAAPPAAGVSPAKPKPSPKRPPKPKLSSDDQPKKTKLKPKSSPMTNGVKEDPKGHINQWKAVQTSKPDGATVYVPRKIMNPADASKIVQRRSYSSSSSDFETSPRRVMVKKAGAAAASSTSPMVPSPRLAMSSPDGSGSSLLDHGYTRVTQEPRDEAAASVAMSSYSSPEINIRSLDRHLLHVTLSPSSTNASSPPNSLSANVLKELTVLLRQLKAEKEVNVVLITSGGPEFCTGIDFSALLSDSIPTRKENARNIANIVQDFIVELANCDKILVGGVNGAAVGLGVTMLRYFDVVYASDKSTFFLPYAKLAQGTEGGSSLVLQNSATPNNLFGLMLYEGRRLTAEEAKTAGLVNDVLWRSDFREVLMPRVQAIATQSSQAMLSMKKNFRLAFRLKLPAILKQESKLLRETWPSEEFQRRAAAVLSSGQLLPS